MRRWLGALGCLLFVWLLGLGARARRHAVAADAGVTAVAEAGVEPVLDPSRVAMRPPNSNGRLEGFVGDGGGHGVPGATVCATPIDEDLVDEETVPYCTVAGESGAYVLVGLPNGTYEVTASAPFHRPASTESVVHFADTQHAVDLVLGPDGVAVSGTVEDPLGRRVPGARVRALALAESDDEFPTVVTTTDAEGRYTLWVPSGAVLLEVHTKDHTRADRRTRAPSTEHFSLSFGGTLVGLVVDESGAPPAALAKIAVLQGGESYSARTDLDGSFRIDGLAAGHATIEATAEGLLGASLGGVYVAAGDLTAAPPVVMHPIARVVGSIRTPSGVCTSGSVTLAQQDGAHTLVSTSVRPDGTARFPSVHAGTFQVSVTCAGFADAASTLTVGKAGTTTFTVDVARGATLHGVVLAADGSPLALGSVLATSGQMNRSTRVEKGGFELTGLSPGTYTLEVQAKGHADAQATVTIASLETVSVRVVLVRGATLTGKVVDEAGKSMVGARVQYETKDGKGHGEAEVDEKGVYVIRDLPAGEGFVRVEKGGFGLGLRVPLVGEDEGAHATVVAGVTTTTNLTVEACTHTLFGSVIGADGKPVAKAKVQIGRRAVSSGGGFGYAEAVTDASGAFSIGALPEGNYSVRADGPDLASAAFVAATPVDAKVTLELAPLGRIVGTVASGKVPFQVHVTSADLNVYLGQTPFASGGAFAFNGLPPGNYTVTASAGDATATSEVTLGAGEERVLALVPVATP